jgi:hypothetical protein
MRGLPPAAESYQGPDGFNESEGPCALEEAVNRAEHAGEGEGKDEPGAAIFERVGNKHGGDSEESVERERAHGRPRTEYNSKSGAR